MSAFDNEREQNPPEDEQYDEQDNSGDSNEAHSRSRRALIDTPTVEFDQ